MHVQALADMLAALRACTLGNRLRLRGREVDQRPVGVVIDHRLAFLWKETGGKLSPAPVIVRLRGSP